MITILLVDDQATVREGLKMRLALEPDLHIIGEAENGIAAVQAAQTLQPDVIIMDVEMPQMDGITAAQLLHTLVPESRVVMLSIHSNAETRARAHAAGAAAFVEKQGAVAALLQAVRSVETGNG